MGWKRRIVSLCRTGVIAVLALTLLAFLFVQIQQHILRKRAEHLLADFQSIRLHQSTWADAQTFMHRWGAWGHYDGNCTPADCDYAITISDAFSASAEHIHSDRGYAVLRHMERLYSVMGGREATMRVRFLIQDGTMWRSAVLLRLYVPPQNTTGEDVGYVLKLVAKSSDALRQKYDPVSKRLIWPWVLGDDDQLGQHPNYKAGRPSGCEICLSGEVTFTPDISPGELITLSSYNLSCLTRYFPCLNLPDVLPVARNWHFYPSLEPAYEVPPLLPPHACTVPLFALARDAGTILLVDVLSDETIEKMNDPVPFMIITAKTQLVTTLKGQAPAPDGATFTIHPAEANPQESHAAEHVQLGKRYIIIPSRPLEFPIVALEFCGIFPDSPEAEAQVQKGIALNDTLRNPNGIGTFW